MVADSAEADGGGESYVPSEEGAGPSLKPRLGGHRTAGRAKSYISEAAAILNGVSGRPIRPSTGTAAAVPRAARQPIQIR